MTVRAGETRVSKPDIDHHPDKAGHSMLWLLGVANTKCGIQLMIITS
jgi:hypothetical protein